MSAHIHLIEFQADDDVLDLADELRALDVCTKYDNELHKALRIDDDAPVIVDVVIEHNATLILIHEHDGPDDHPLHYGAHGPTVDLLVNGTVDEYLDHLLDDATQLDDYVWLAAPEHDPGEPLYLDPRRTSRHHLRRHTERGRD